MAAPRVRVVWDRNAIKLLSTRDARVKAAMDRLAGKCVNRMKYHCPVSPVMPAYASPVPMGSSSGPTYQGRGLARPGGPDRSRYRSQGDLPLRPSGYLRSSIHAFRMSSGNVIIGPTAPYARYVVMGTPPHGIDSTGPWPLRNRATGQVFGPHVNHPGTRPNNFIQRAAYDMSGEVVRI